MTWIPTHPDYEGMEALRVEKLEDEVTRLIAQRDRLRKLVCWLDKDMYAGERHGKGGDPDTIEKDKYYGLLQPGDMTD